MSRNITFTNFGACGAVLLAAALLRFCGSSARWTGGHIGYNGATYSIVARNHLRYGFLATKFLSAKESPCTPGALRYNIHHPPLLGILTASSFYLFGESEFSARLLPIIFSIGNLCLLYLLVRPLWGSATALLSVFFAAFMTMDAFYGPQVEVFGSLVLFFILCAYLCYRRWICTSRASYLFASLLSLTLAIFTEWTGYYTLILIAVEEWLRREFPRTFRPIFRLYLSVGVGAFLLYLAMVRIATGAITGGTWVEAFLFRLNMGHGAASYPFTLSQYIRTVASYLIAYFGYSVLVLSAAGLVAVFISDAGEENAGRLVVALNLLILGWVHLVVFRNVVYIHSYTLFNLTPSLSLLAAIGAVRARNYAARFSPLLGYGMLGAILLLHAGSSIEQLHREHQGLDFDRGYRFGNLVQSLSGQRDIVICSFDRRPEYEYYADRIIIYGVTSRDDLEKACAEVKGRRIAWYAADELSRGRIDERLLGYLSERYPCSHYGTYTLFDMRDGSSGRKNDEAGNDNTLACPQASAEI